MQNKKITIKHIQDKKKKKIPVTMLTAYDNTSEFGSSSQSSEVFKGTEYI